MADKGTEKWQFEAHARLVTLLGDELIETPTVAVYELAKNGYDADASKVVVRLHGRVLTEDEVRERRTDEGFPDIWDEDRNRPQKGQQVCRVERITVADDGHGMTREELKEGWMRLGASGKAEQTSGRRVQQRSRSGRRVMLGEKGVGRLAAARLGSRLRLVTTPAEGTTSSVLTCDWGLYDNSPGLLADAPSGAVFEEVPRGDRPQGTKLTISGIRAQYWSTSDIEDLGFNLATLLDPFDGPSDFRVDLSAPIDVGRIGEGLVDRSHYQVSASVRREEGQWVLSGLFRARYASVSETIRRVLPSAQAVGPLSIELRVFERTSQDLKEASIDRREFGLLKHYAGLSVYRDGLRVLPYGLPDNDWLRLDRRRTSDVGPRLGNSQILGRILITAEANHGLRDQTHRQGFVENAAFRALKDVVLELLRQVERIRAKVRAQSSERSVSLPVLDRAIREVVKAAQASTTPPAEDVVANLNTWVRDVRTRLDLYLRIGASGVASEMATHDMNNAMRGLRQASRVVIAAARGASPSTKVSAACDQLETTVETLSSAFAVLRPVFARGRQRSSVFPLAKAVEDIVRLFDYSPTRDRIEVRLRVPRDVTVRMVPGQLNLVLLNLLDNSFYWVTEGDSPEPIVSVRAGPKGETVTVRITNSGPPIPDDDLPYVTEPFYTTKRLPDARGLGLYIVQDVLANIDSRLRIKAQGPLGGPVFSFDLPRGEDIRER